MILNAGRKIPAHSMCDGFGTVQACLAYWTERGLVAEHAVPCPAGESYEAYAELARHDDRFHRLIGELAGNAQLRHAFERTHCHTHLFRRRYSTRLGTATIAEHREIAEAVAAGTPARARAAMTAHLRQAFKRLS
jgi:DNA-binding GntR family transcriptional regulator